MKSILTLLLILFFAITAFAQSGMQDVIYLQNGSVIRGTILEHDINKSIKIKTSDGSILVYPSSEVTKIAKEPFRGQKAGIRKGHTFSFEAGYHPGVGKIKVDDYPFGDPTNDDAAVAIHLINGYRFNEYFSLSAGVGFYKFEEFEEIPVFADFLVLFNPHSNASPYLSLNIGAGLPTVKKESYGYGFNSISMENKAGLVINPNFGFRVGGQSAFVINVGYMIHNFKYELSGISYYGYGSFQLNETIKLRANFLTMRVGFMMN